MRFDDLHIKLNVVKISDYRNESAKHAYYRFECNYVDLIYHTRSVQNVKSSFR